MKLAENVLWICVKMSLDRFKAQSYAPIRLQPTQLSGFFESLRRREFVRGDDAKSSVKLSDKPFQTPQYEQVDLGVTEPISKNKIHLTHKVPILVFNRIKQPKSRKGRHQLN